MGRDVNKVVSTMANWACEQENRGFYDIAVGLDWANAFSSEAEIYKMATQHM